MNLQRSIVALFLAITCGLVATSQDYAKKAQEIDVNGVKFNMVYVEGGSFMMGATSDQKGWAKDESPVHEVVLDSYYIGETEVTQALWIAVMGENPSHFTSSVMQPVESISWKDCKEFIARLNEITGLNFRFLTEAEWEYAARGGNKSEGYLFSGSNNLETVAWCDANSNSSTHAVATKNPNELGIYDMSGNVGEWCGDWYGDYSSQKQLNPKGAKSSSYKVSRGGAWFSREATCRVADRNSSTLVDSGDCLGLRLACTSL